MLGPTLALTLAFAPLAQPYGWDPGLTRRCLVEGPRAHPIVVSDCSGEARWTFGLHSESAYGPEGQCPQFPHVNAATAPVRIAWRQDPADGLVLDVTTDLIDDTHVCGEGYFTWTVLMDQNRAARYPTPFDTRLRATVTLDGELRSGALRAIVGWQGWWNGEAHVIEIAAYLENWGVTWGSDFFVTAPTLDFVFVDGASFGLQPLIKRQETELVIDWGPVIARCIAEGHIQPIPDGMPSATAACYVGYELHNWRATDAGRATMSIRDVHIESTAAAAGVVGVQ